MHFATASGELGRYGAAGVLLKTATKTPRYLLQRRSDATFEPNTWTVPGGALHSRETPGQGAARELMEEAGIRDFEAIRPIRVTRLRSLNWTYTTIIGEVPEQFPVTPTLEAQEYKWFTATQIRNLHKSGKLHPLFARTLDHLI
jgi:8-oxo-dGTP diphosphatase